MIRRDVSNYTSEIESIKNYLSEIDKYSSIVDFSVFTNIVHNFKDSWFAQATDYNILNWLFEEGQNDMEYYQENEEVLGITNSRH